VHGVIPEDVGPFKAGHSYDANHARTMVWVQATLVDTSVMMYRAILGPMPEAELDAVVREMLVHRNLFGLPSNLEHRATWKSFSAYFHRVTTSRLVHCTCGDGIVPLTATPWRGQGANREQ